MTALAGAMKRIEDLERELEETHDNCNSIIKDHQDRIAELERERDISSTNSGALERELAACRRLRDEAEESWGNERAYLRDKYKKERDADIVHNEAVFAERMKYRDRAREAQREAEELRDELEVERRENRRLRNQLDMAGPVLVRSDGTSEPLKVGEAGLEAAFTGVTVQEAVEATQEFARIIGDPELEKSETVQDKVNAFKLKITELETKLENQQELRKQLREVSDTAIRLRERVRELTGKLESREEDVSRLSNGVWQLQQIIENAREILDKVED